jgi:Holliday junction resolvase RusA-like endonuclease
MINADDLEWSAPKTGVIIFECAGIPVGQGAHSISKSGHIYETSKGHKSWRQELVEAAKMAKPEVFEMITAPVEVVVTFVFPRPKSHYGTGKTTAGVVKGGAPRVHTSFPDLDHLLRCLCDSLELSGLIKNDNQICSLRSEKIYGVDPGAYVMITEV